jgi:TetR/AcrR family acrAB operon transcriptional repressor
MARKTKQEAQATRDGILDAAEACFHEVGVNRTTLEMIGGRAGFTRGAVYWHFKNKAEVLAAVIQRCRVPFMQKLERASSDSRSTPIEDLRSVILLSWRDLDETPRLRCLLEIMLRRDVSNEYDVLRQTHSEGMQDSQLRMTNAFTRAASLGQLRPGVCPQRAARMLHITLTGVLYTSIFEPDTIDMCRDGMAALDTTLSALVNDEVFVPGAAPGPLPPEDMPPPAD